MEHVSGPFLYGSSPRRRRRVKDPFHLDRVKEQNLGICENIRRNHHSTPFRKRHLIPQDIRKCRIAILALERRRPKQHFINEDTERPPVDGGRVAVALDDFWRNILFGADKGIGAEVGDAGFRVDGG